MRKTQNNLSSSDLWVKVNGEVDTPSFWATVDWIIDNPIQEKKELTLRQSRIIIDKLVEIVQKFNKLSDIQEIEAIIKEIEFNLSLYRDNYSSVRIYTDKNMLRYFNRTILKWKDRIIIISLEKIEYLLKSRENNDLTEEQRKELEKLTINCNQIIEIDNPQKIEIYIKKLEELNSMIKGTGIDDNWIKTLLYNSRWNILSLVLKQEEKEN